ncbi:MAG TPA: 2Fe-2S iron-sulfur cluster-binding protein [Vicinamibacteria bacterium]|nr:2Fe-2S iron-sulfur cluster-binding protein [Vicinamibacteria bacterium]
MVQIPAEAISIFFNGREILLEASGRFAGAALLAAAGKSENLPASDELPYLFCGNGACRDCNLHVDGIDDVASCRLPLTPWMSFRPGEGAGEENALSRNLRGLDRGEKEPFDVELLIVGAGRAGSAALEAARSLGIEGVVFDARSDRGTPRPVSVRDGRLRVAEEGFVREVRARAVILATGRSKGPEGNEPQLAIAKALGCRTIYDRILRYERLALDAEGRTSIPGVFAAGDAESGRRAGKAAACDLEQSP